MILPGRRQLVFGLSMALLAGCTVAVPKVCADERGWDFESYRITATIALDVSGDVDKWLAVELPKDLQQRASSSVGPLWNLVTHVGSGVEREGVFAHVESPGAAIVTEDVSTEADKRILVVVRETPEGFAISARELDVYLARWGLPIHRLCRQAENIPERVFGLLRQSVSTLAQVDVDPGDSKRVVLKPRGGALTKPAGAISLIASGDVLLPILRRSARSGQLLKDGIQPVPWTFIEAVEDEKAGVVGHVHSATRRPFGARRQGRIELLAIAVTADPAPVTVSLHKRTSDKAPQVGYEIHSQDKGAEELTLVGLTDTRGKLEVSPGKQRIQNLFVKNGGQLLARVPVAFGAEREIALPLPDDDMRLAAEVRLAAVREDLIDVVARRNILIARTRQKIEKKDFAAAEELLSALDALPGRSQFDLTVTSAARTLKSDDPRIQQRIDNLFKQTRSLLTQFLDARPINELHNELRAARQNEAS